MTRAAALLVLLALLLALACSAPPARAPARSPDRALAARLRGGDAAWTVAVYLDDASAPQRGFLGLWPPGTPALGEPWWTSPLYAMWHAEVGALADDGTELVVLGVWSTKPRHDEPQPHRTVRVLGWNGRALVELWRGSALARPLRDFTLADTDADGTVELLALEQHPGDTTACALTTYRWSGFGFHERARQDAPCAELTLPGRTP